MMGKLEIFPQGKVGLFFVLGNAGEGKMKAIFQSNWAH